MAFEDLISHINFKYIFMSYNNEGIMTPENIKNIMSKYGRYKILTQEYKRFKSNNNIQKNNIVTEYIHCLIKN